MQSVCARAPVAEERLLLSLRVALPNLLLSTDQVTCCRLNSSETLIHGPQWLMQRCQRPIWNQKCWRILRLMSQA